MKKRVLNILLIVGVLVSFGGVIWSLKNIYSVFHEPMIEGGCDKIPYPPTCTAFVRVSEKPLEPVQSWIDEDSSHNKTLLFVKIVDQSGLRIESYESVIDPRINTGFWVCSIKNVEIIKEDWVIEVVTPKIISGCL